MRVFRLLVIIYVYSHNAKSTAGTLLALAIKVNERRGYGKRLGIRPLTHPTKRYNMIPLLHPRFSVVFTSIEPANFELLPIKAVARLQHEKKWSLIEVYLIIPFKDKLINLLFFIVS